MTGRRIDEAFLKRIAEQYTEHVQAKVMPAPAIAEAENAPVRTVHRWIYEARKRGLLPPGTPSGLCGGKVEPRQLGTAGEQVARNVRLMRTARHLTYAELSDRLGAAGRPIPVLGLRRLEVGDRRVDVDDLMALASVFGVQPETLWVSLPDCPTCHGAPPPGFSCTRCASTGPMPDDTRGDSQ